MVLEVGFIGRLVVKAGMRTAPIVEIEVPPDRGTRRADAVVGVKINLLVLDRPPQPLDEHIVPRRGEARLRHDAPLPSMLILMSRAASTLVNAGHVNCEP